MIRTKSVIVPCIAALASCWVAGTEAADKVRIGFVATLSGTNSVIGIHARDAFNLAIEHSGGKLGGLPVEVLVEDDQQKPDVARQIADKFVEFDKVDVVVGPVISSALLAASERVTSNKTVMIGPNAGPSPLAGDKCSEYYFSTSWQGDNLAEAMGSVLQNKGVKKLYVMAPNFLSGRDVINGIKRYYKGTIAGEVYTPLNQLDFAAELAQLRAAKPDAVFAFYPSGLAIQFVKQFVQSGMKEQFPLYMSYSVDNMNLPAIGDAALGITVTDNWSHVGGNEENRKFVADFMRKYKYAPSATAAQAYDAGRLLDSAIGKVNGKIEDKKAFLAAIKAADFHSVRGNFKFNTNHFPIQDLFNGTVVKGADGEPVIELGNAVMKEHGDVYAAKCSLK